MKTRPRNTKSRIDDEDISSPADQIRASLEEIAAAVTGDGPVHGKMTVREVTIRHPAEYDARAVRRLRTKMGVSQRLFAQIVGVSPQLVEHWEQGLRKLHPLARRLLEKIEEDPTGYVRSVIQSVRI